MFRGASRPNDRPPPNGVWPTLPATHYTSWIARFAAWLLDMIPILVGAGIGNAVDIGSAHLDCVTYENGGVACSATRSVTGDIAFALVSAFVLSYCLWNYGYRQGATGSSIGKSVLKFRVVHEKTWQPVGFGRSIVRQLAHSVDAIVCFVGYLFPLWDAKRQTLADKIVATVCVPRNPSPGPGAAQRQKRLT
ncbi:hypothetical protein NGTWS1803_34310 [Mycolicibacterium cyprinidarum]|nr:hypothetical protein NGTWS1803_34310 [Mycolicibacterium sp. NGTWS1803]